MTKAMSELFKLPLVARQRGTDADWCMAIVEQGDMIWVAEVYPRTEGHWGQTLLVSAQERGEAIVAAVNERDALRNTLCRIADNANYLEPVEVRNLALAALGGGLEKIGEVTK
jgi:hypothetical protein